MTTTTIASARLARQRTAALAQANRVRHRRRLLRQRIARRDPPQGAALACATLLHPPDYARTMTVERLLTAINAFGSVRAKAIAGQHQRAALDALDAEDRARIAARCQQAAANLAARHRHGPVDHEQAMRALAGADRVRLARACALRAIARAPGRGTAAWRAAVLISASSRSPELQGLTVHAVVEAIPKVGETATRRLLEELQLSGGVRLEMLSRARAARIAATVLARYGQPALPAPAAAPARPLPRAA
jgi:hypothetical protein